MTEGYFQKAPRAKKMPAGSRLATPGLLALSFLFVQLKVFI